MTAGDVDATAQHLWSRSLEAERERRVTDRVALTGGSLKTIRGHVSRDLDREIAHEMERNPERVEAVFAPSGDVDTVELGADEAAWEATRLNIVLANKGYNDSDVTRWWNFTRHRELGDRTIAEAWKAAEYGAVTPTGGVPARQARDHQRLLLRRVTPDCTVPSRARRPPSPSIGRRFATLVSLR